ncbi:MAG TPA: bifunctional 4-hydroxy-2-oxoglutarate aldolase/2-dehydro-3-deoxy-phosphogluconate aldolase [Campylobacteraceae bacterium]|nr:bifunctional 4-hydroxy-2-oxoglutarate aldolase/2-dehydro-3-deoxy-phosphogluconate aldolase [Campylobacteraceae bacterium]
MTAQEVMEISPVVPVIALERAEDALPLAEALLAGGVGVMEITLRTDAGLDAIKSVSDALPEMAVGAGTVVNGYECRKAVDYGAQFIFSPGISQELIESAEDETIALIPGVATASEVMLAQNSGLHYCKLFPATVAGGTAALKAFSGPFASMRFCPTGGVTPENMHAFLSLPNVLCVGGSWIVPKPAIRAGDFAAVTRLCREALGTIGDQ